MVNILKLRGSEDARTIAVLGAGSTQKSCEPKRPGLASKNEITLPQRFYLGARLVCTGFVFLAHYAQGPDGAEMVSTALAGGVLHPSGMPLQAWLNRLAVLPSPLSAAWTLSLLSWTGHVLTCFVLAGILRELRACTLAVVVAVLAYSTHAVVASLALQPEKYSWLTFFLLLSFLFMAGGQLIGVALAFALAMAQHTASALLLPALFLFVLVNWRKSRHDLALALGLWWLVVGGFYISLLWLRAVRPWPDWGQLTTPLDVWNHFRRADFANGLLNPDGQTHEHLNPFWIMLLGLQQWALFIPAFAFGVAALFRTERKLFWLWLCILISGSALLVYVDLPVDLPALAHGYGERYQMVVLPFLAIAIGLGTAHARGLSFAAVILSAWFGLRQIRAVDNNLVEIYREQVGHELPAHAIYVSREEMDLFYGVPCDAGLCFPLKDLFGNVWYKDKTAPALEPRVREIFARNPQNYDQFLSAAVHLGFAVASSTGSSLTGITDLQGHLEQTGLVWLSSREDRPLYTSAILRNALRSCANLTNVWHEVPLDGAWFEQNLLKQFHYVFIGAGDAFTNLGNGDAAKRAYAVGEALQPGVPTATWQTACAELAQSWTE